MTNTTTRSMHLYDRVTDILYSFSGLDKVNPEVLKNAGLRGTIVHECCDCIMQELPLYDIDPKYQGYLTSFESWAKDKKFLDKPARFFDDELMITGECDGLYEKDGVITLFDIKTPLREGPTWHLQGAAYVYLATKAGYKVDKLEFVKLDKTGKEPIVYSYVNGLKDFMLCVEIYRRYFKTRRTELEDF